MSALPPAALRRLAALAIDAQGFVFDPRTGHTYTANPTALAVLAWLRVGLDRDAVADRLRDGFADVDAAVLDDLAEFARQLQEYDLLPPGALPSW